MYQFTPCISVYELFPSEVNKYFCTEAEDKENIDFFPEFLILTAVLK